MRSVDKTSGTPFQRLRKKGVAILWVILTVSATVGIAGLASDTGYVMLTGHQLQKAADNAALAAALQVQTNTSLASTAAINAAAGNTAAGSPVQLANTDIVFGTYNSTTGAFTANATPYNAVSVTARRTSGSPGGPLNLIFGPIFNVKTANVSRQSIATAGGTMAAGIVVLSPTASGSLTVTGSSSIGVSNGGCVQVNSNHPSAVSCHSSCSLSCNKLRIKGGCSGSTGSLPPATYSNTTACNDPCNNLPAPTKGTDNGTCTKTAASGTVTVTPPSFPAYYSGGITCGGGCTVVLSPGTYILGGAGLNVGSNCNFYATGCTFYLTTGKTGTYAPCNITTTGVCYISPPTSGTYASCECCIFHDRNAPSTTSCSITCNNLTNISGLVYAPSCGVSVSGNGSNLAHQVICNTLQCSGSGSCSVNYDNCNPVTVNNVCLCQ